MAVAVSKVIWGLMVVCHVTFERQVALSRPEVEIAVSALLPVSVRDRTSLTKWGFKRRQRLTGRLTLSQW